MTHCDNDHTHGCSGGCCGGQGGCCSQNTTFNQQEREFLMELMERQFLPMAQFVVTSTQTHDFEMVALSPVYLYSPTDTMEQISETAKMLHKMEGLGLLTLDFDEGLDPMSYEIYQQSTAFGYLEETVAMAKEKGGLLGDTATIQQGTIAVTPLCLHRYSA